MEQGIWVAERDLGPSAAIMPFIARNEQMERSRHKLRMRALAMGDAAFVRRIGQERINLQTALLALCMVLPSAQRREHLSQVLLIARNCGLLTLERTSAAALETDEAERPVEFAAVLARLQRLGHDALQTLESYVRS